MKNPLYVDRVIIRGGSANSSNGIFLDNGAGTISSVVDNSGNIDAPATAASATYTGTVTISAGGKITTSVASTLFPVKPTAVQQAINANGAIGLTQYNTAITSVSSTGQTFTLADSTVTGQLKRIQMIVDDGDATVTFNTNATIVFADVGDVAELIFNGSDWIPIALYNIVDGATAPVYTPAS